MPRSMEDHHDYITDKCDRDECLVKGCLEKQDDQYWCLAHDREEDYFWKECDRCNIPVPIIIDNCDFHGGTTYSVGMREKFESAIKKDSLKDTLKKNVKSALSRTSVNAIVIQTQRQLLNILKKSGIDNGVLSKISIFLETDIGKAFYTTTLASLMTLLPDKIGSFETIDIADELRVKAISDLGESTMNLLLPTLTNVLLQTDSLKEVATELQNIYEEDVVTINK